VSAKDFVNLHPVRLFPLTTGTFPAKHQSANGTRPLISSLTPQRT
jgi:hypothetical protein